MSKNLVKKIFAGLSAAAMVFVALPSTTFAAAHPVGTNVDASGTVWMIYNGQSGVCRRAYTSAGAFLSYGFNSWSQVVAANADDLALPVCSEGFIPPQDGGIIFSDRGSDQGTGYVISGGMKYGFPTEAVFKGQGYSYSNATWADVSWMSMGGVVNDAAQAHVPGTLVNNGGTVQLVGNSGLMGIPDIATFNSWGYSFAKVVPANAADTAKAQTGVMASRQAGQLSPVAMTSTPQPTGPFSAMVHSTNPAAGTVIAGQAIADLAHFTISGNGTVTSVVLQRNGVSADSTLSAVYLYDGNNRLTDSASVSSGVINFNDAAGIFTVSGSRTISVRSNIAASTAGQTVGVTLTHINGTALASTPSSNIMSVAAAPSSFATIDFNTTTTPAASTISPQEDFTMWQNVVTVGNNKVSFRALKLRQVGSVNTADLGNFRLYVDGTMVGSAVAAMDSQGYVNFDLGTGVELQTGSRTIKMVGNIIGGSNRNFSFSLRHAADGMFVDTQFGQPVLPTANSSTFSARSSGTQTIDTGVLTITKRSDSPSGNIVNTASGQVLGRFDVKAFGENMKIESLRVAIAEDDTDTAYTLRNGALYLDGVQIGSTAAIASDDDSTLAYTEFTFGSSAIIVPGTPRVLEIRADVYDNDGANGVTANDTIQVTINAGSSNVQRMSSLGFGSYPASNVTGNTLTVATGSLTIAKNTSYANHTIVAPKTAYKLGSYNIQASTTEGANITSVVVDFDTVADAFDASDDLTNLYIVVGSYTSPIKSTVADSANTYSTNVSINPGQTIALDVYSDVASSATDGDATADTGISSVTVAYTTTGSSTSTTASEVTGQTITFGSGTFTTALDGASPLNRIVAGNQEVEAARYKFTAANESYTIKEIQVKVGSAAISSVTSSVQLYDGATPIGSPAPFAQSSNTAALVTGLNVSVPANSNKVITAKLMLNTIGTGAGTSQSNAALTLDSVEYADSQGVETTSTTDRAGNEMYVYKSIPTVTQVPLTNQTLVNGTATDLYKFTVTASSQGPVALKQFILTTTWSDGGTADTLEVESMKLFEDGVDVTANVTIQDEAGNTAESTSGLTEADADLTVSWDAGKESLIPAGGTKTYVVRGTPQGFRLTGADTVGDSVSFYLAGDSAHNSTKVYLNGISGEPTIWGLHTAADSTGSGTLYQFIWSDNASSTHTAAENASSTDDWANGYKVLNLDLGGQTWTK